MSKPDLSVEPIFDKKEAITEIIKKTTEWNLKFTFSKKVSSLQDIFSEVGKINCYGERDRPTFVALNQLLSGHQISIVTVQRLTRIVPVSCVIPARSGRMLNISYFIVANVQQRGIGMNGQWKTSYLEKVAMMLRA